MKKLVLVLSVALLVGVSTVNAKRLPAVAAKLPADLKKEIVDNLKYPNFASTNFIEGEVWMKFSLTEDSKVKIVDLSATNQELGKYVKKELANLIVENHSIAPQHVYYLKVKFDLLKN